MTIGVISLRGSVAFSASKRNHAIVSKLEYLLEASVCLVQKPAGLNILSWLLLVHRAKSLEYVLVHRAKSLEYVKSNLICHPF